MFSDYFETSNKTVLCEDDIRHLFLSQQKRHSGKLRLLNKLINFFFHVVVIFVILYTIINAPALWIEFGYVARNTAFPVNSVNTRQAITSNPILPSPDNHVTTVGKQENNQNNLPNNRLIISKLNLNAPINWDVPNQNQTVMDSLESGVAQIQGTAKPGEAGNIFIVGHSSNYIWAKGNYKQVFALLPNLSVGDQIIITYQNQEYDYTVNKIETVSPNDISVMDIGNQPELSLMTCTPIGTNLNRLIIIAKPDNPAASKNPVPVSGPTGSSDLPAVQ